MRIVALDTHVVAFDGLSFDIFKTLGDFTAYPRTGNEQIVRHAANAEAILVNKVVITAQIGEQLPALRYVGITATGTNNVDLEYCRARGIAVTNVTNYATDAVAQHVFALILHHYSRATDFIAQVKHGEWAAALDFTLPRGDVFELRGKKLGIVGYGHIGQRVAEIGRVFGMQILIAHSPHTKLDKQESGVGRESLDTLFAESDALTLHCALSPLTARMVNAERLALMKHNSILINTARGGLVDEPALANALQAGSIAAAYLDVLDREPPQDDSPLLSCPQAYITPHVAWSAREARERLITEAAANLKAYCAGQSRNRVV